MSPHFLSKENNESLLISVPNINRLKMNGATLICIVEYNQNNLKIGFRFCLSFHPIIWSPRYYKLLKRLTFLKNKGDGFKQHIKNMFNKFSSYWFIYIYIYIYIDIYI